MSELTRLAMLTQQMHLEPSGGLECPDLSLRKQDSIAVSHAMLPNGRKLKLLKTLLTSVCERDCYYCPFRAGRDFRRATFKPDEFAKIFMYMHKAGLVEGVFLSSGVVNGGVYTQDRLLATAEILRHKYSYRGYLHLKMMPGAQQAQVEQAMLLADRVSVNLEAPNTERLRKLAPHKEFIEELLTPLRWVEEIRKTQTPHKAWKGTWPSTVTQFVVGGADESDIELLSTTEYLHRQMGLARAYFSAFSPVVDTPLENKSPTPQERQNRLYQASFLIRDYGFNLEEMPFEGNGNLPLGVDPKTAWAQQSLQTPVEVNTAPRELLLRIPGIGPKSVAIILKTRRESKFRDLSQLAKLGIRAKQAAPFILLDGTQPAYQMALF
ncbi:MAG: radical SAM protein [Chloroflexi bacterium]|jgi:predicted DNA-binding helix-hairpin-helix protein|nr:radical SAM protein [Chloroflexota bacterium]